MEVADDPLCLRSANRYVTQRMSKSPLPIDPEDEFRDSTDEALEMLGIRNL
jgi:hypothetical protein